VTVEPLPRHPFHEVRRQTSPPFRKALGPLVEQGPARELLFAPRWVWPEDRTMDKPKQERRNEARRRRRALKRARIIFKGRCATIDCTVLNLSDVGACLKVESPIGIPDTFDLVLDNAPVRGCRVTWRKATQIGVAFA
jgi:hypothetical protein